MERAGLPYSPTRTYAKIDRKRGRRIAENFTMMIHDPRNPEVKLAYQVMIKETIAQYREILGTGLQVEFIRGADPYGNPRKAILDVVENNHLWVFPTSAGFGSDAKFDASENPLLAETEFKISGETALANDVFRVVHDYFGHVKDGVGFRAEGEENAWRSHAAMYSPIARRAMTSETRGQNSFVNFGPNGERNRFASGADTIYADQKIGLLPKWVSEDGAHDIDPRFSKRAFHGTPHHFDKFSTDKIGTGEGVQAYGHGLYFAENPAVAENYRQQLSYKEAVRQFRNELPDDADSDELMDLADNGEFSPETARVIKALAADDWLGFDFPSQAITAAFREMENFDPSEELRAAVREYGAVYEVEIPDEAADKFLDWDKTISEQTPQVRALLKKAIDDQGLLFAVDDPLGQGVYSRLNMKLRSQEAASKYLNSVGIRGIKYFDGHSRGAGEGSRNLVVFDDSLVKTVSKNGSPVFSKRASKDDQPQTETAAFKRWFGNSKVVDEKGDPMRVYHGSHGDRFDAFDPGRRGSRFDNPVSELGFYFADEATAERYAKGAAGKKGGERPQVYAAYLSLQNPADIDGSDLSGTTQSAEDMAERIVEAQESGHDGAIIRGWKDGSGSKVQYVAFDPEQIKSATDNAGSFDPKNPSILASNRVRHPWIFERDKLGNFRFAAGARAYRIVADVANAVLAKFKLKPISSELGRAMRRMQAEIAAAKEKAANVAGKLSTLSPEEREMISDVIERELRAGVTPPEKILAIAANMQHIMSEQTKQLVDLGMMTEESASRWDGKYLPRFYQKQFKDELKAWARAARQLFGKKGAMQGIAGNSLKARGLFKDINIEELPAYEENGWEVRDPGYDKDSDQVTIWRDFTKEERANMNEIRDSMFRFVMGYMRSQKDIALGRLYRHIARTMASRGPKDGYVQVPDTSVEGTTAKRYGELAGKWVPQEVLDHLSAADSSEINELFKMYLKGVAAWKEGRTVLNPVSHVNNVVSNVTMAHMAGVSYWDAHKYAGAARDLVKKAPMVQEAKEAGLFGGTFNQADLLNNMPEQLKVMAGMSESAVTKAAGHVWNAMSFWMRKPLGKAYQAEDEFFRYLIYRDARQRGVEPDAAVEHAQEYIFTYDDLPKGARAIRDTVVPFFSWTYKAIPALARTAFEYPWRFAAPAAVLWSANAAMYAMAGGEGDDEPWWEHLVRYVRDPVFRAAVHELEDGERSDLPPWNRGSTAIGTPKVVRMGQDDVTNLPMFLDVSRLMPGGDMFDTENNAGGIPWFAPLDPGGPAVNVLFGMFGNLDYFTGKNIVSDADTDAEAAEKRAAWMYQAMAPSIAPFGYHFNRAMNALAYGTDTTINLGAVEYTGFGKDGLPVQPSLAALQTFGIKLRDVDLQQSRAIQDSQRARLVRDINSQVAGLKRLRAAGAISDEAYEEQVLQAREKKARLKQGLTVEGDEEE